MEVINFKTKHEINQTVYIVNNGIILETKVKGVLFTEAPYQYKLLGKDGGVFFVYEEDVSDSIEQAIEKAVLQHKEKLQREYFPPKAKAPDAWGIAVSELEERYKPEK